MIVSLVAAVAGLGSCAAQPARDTGVEWRARLDPGRVGEQEAWSSPRYDDSDWTHTSLGTVPPAAEDETADLVWYRAWVPVPGAARRAGAAFEARPLTSPCRVWINGFLEAERRRAAEPWLAVPLGEFSRQERVLVAICVTHDGPWEGAEATGSVAALAGVLRGPEAVQLEAHGFARLVGQLRPDDAWPAWMTDRPAQRTFVGSEGLGPCAYLADDGTVQPRRDGLSVAPLLALPGSAGIHAPSPTTVTWALADGQLPLPVAVWQPTKEITVRIRPLAWAEHDGRQTGAVWFRVRNGDREPRRVLLGLMVRPYGLTGEIAPIRALRMTNAAAAADGQTVLRCTPAATYVAAGAPADGEAEWVRWRGKRPETAEATDPRGLAGGAFVYDLSLQPTGTKDIVVLDWTGRDRPEEGSPPPLSPAPFVQELETFWRGRLDRLALELPDPAGWCGEAFLSSAAYLLIGDGPAEPPASAARGPSPEQQAFRAEALRQAGFAEAAEAQAMGVAGQQPVGAPQGAARLDAAQLLLPVPGLLRAADAERPLAPEVLQRWWDELAAPTGGGVGDQTRVFGAGMALGALWAQAEQRDRAGAVLSWYLAYETSRHMHAWGEALDPLTGEYQAGALPDLDAAAGFIRLVRACVAYETDDRLCLLAGLPADWLLSGWPLRARGLPTAFGRLDLLAQSAGQELRIETGPDCQPPGGYVIPLPAEPRAAALRIDRQRAVLADPTHVTVPPGAHSVAILFPGSSANE